MNKSSRVWSTVISDMNNNSSTESNSEEDKCRLAAMNLIFSDVNHEAQFTTKQQMRKFSSSRNSLINHRDLNRSNRKSFDESMSINNGIKHDTNSSWRSSDGFRLEKTGWLDMRHCLTLSSHEKVDVVSKSQWKRFWIWLKDSKLHFFLDSSNVNPKLTINTIDCLCYPFPEHRQNVFAFTTHTGESYYFQCSNQSELDHWIRSIHSNGSLKINLHALESHLKQVDRDIIYEKKILQLAELQLKLTTNEKTRLIISEQIQLLESNLEIFHFDEFRQRCYLIALNGNESLPNSKDLLAQISSSTKTVLYNLHAFTPCGLYTWIISRERLHHQKSRSKAQMKASDSIETNQMIFQTVLIDSIPQKKVIVSIDNSRNVGDLLKDVTEKFDDDTDDYFLYFTSATLNGFIPNLNTKLNTLTYSTVELCRKIIYQIIVYHQLNLSGIEINRQYPSIILVSYVNKGSEGERLGIMKGDEIIQINNFIVQDLDSTTLTRYLNQIPITLTLRSSRLNQILTNPAIKTSREVNRLSQSINNNEQPSNTQRIRKIIFELIQTERSYVQDLQCLLKQYIEPLRYDTTVLPSDTIESLRNSVKSIDQLQNVFLEKLQLNLFTENIPNAIAETFMRFSKDFKLYSTFCAMHLRINRLLKLHRTNEYLKDFLRTCNPVDQHSSSFQSYLIKPVQRILKYPLFLQQIILYTNIDEHQLIYSLQKAMKMMNKLSKYINSMQELYEEFGRSFEYFIRNSQEQHHQTFELRLSELHAYGEVEWINMHQFLSRKHEQVREQSMKRTLNRNTSDCFIRFLPIRELQVELISNDQKQSYGHTWQIIQTNPQTLFRTYFRFANKDGQTFVKTIKNCIPELSNPWKIVCKEKYVAANRACHDLLPDDVSSNRDSERVSSRNHRRSPSPIWKRRTTSLRKRPSSMPNNRNCK